METAAKEQKLKFNFSGKQPTALVAGGAGFLGSHLCEALVAQKFNVIAVDSLSDEESKQNIAGLLSSPNFSFWEEDINKPGFTISPTIPLSHIFHLASVEERLASSEISLQTLLVNSLGTKNLLDLAVEKRAKFILVSSTEVFHGAISQTSVAAYFEQGADPAQLSFSEAKRFAETLTAEYFKKYNLATTIIRIKDPYGPRMNLAVDNILDKLISQALSRRRIEIVGDGLRTLNPTYVSDIIFGIVKAVLHQAKGEIFNLINPEKFTERAIAEHLRRIVGGVEIVYKKGEELELPFYPLILGPSEEKLGWSPKVPLTQGLSETITFYREKEEKGEKETSKLPAPKVAIPEPKIEKSGRRQTLLRWLIFLSSATLVFWLIVLPIFTLAAATYFGNKNLEQAADSLANDKAQLASDQAAKAEGSYKNGEAASQNISWLANLLRLKSPMRQTENYLFLAENLAAATKFSAETQTAIMEASGAGLSEGQAIENLKVARSKIDLAKRSLEIATSVRCEEETLPKPLRGDYQNLLDKERELTALVGSIDNALRTIF